MLTYNIKKKQKYQESSGMILMSYNLILSPKSSKGSRVSSFNFWSDTQGRKRGQENFPFQTRT